MQAGPAPPNTRPSQPNIPRRPLQGFMARARGGSDFVPIPFGVVKAVANTSLGERLRRRLKATKKAAVDSSARFQALARQAREASFWYGRDRPRWLGLIPYDYPPCLTGNFPALRFCMLVGSC